MTQLVTGSMSIAWSFRCERDSANQTVLSFHICWLCVRMQSSVVSTAGLLFALRQ